MSQHSLYIVRGQRNTLRSTDKRPGTQGLPNGRVLDNGQPYISQSTSATLLMVAWTLRRPTERVLAALFAEGWMTIARGGGQENRPSRLPLARTMQAAFARTPHREPASPLPSRASSTAIERRQPSIRRAPCRCREGWQPRQPTAATSHRIPARPDRHRPFRRRWATSRAPPPTDSRTRRPGNHRRAMLVTQRR